uniref:Uncharacterized protein n=1 Tax=Sphaerodactylus townsendi TaxID=933632 RepID=A0ACB8EW99_9SAUR
MSSQFTVPSADFEKNTYTCIVKHPAITDRQGRQKRIEKRDCVERNPEPIQVRLLTPGCDAENTEINLELVCILLGSGHGEVEVESLINGVVVRPKVKVILSGKQGSGYSSYIKQNITKKSWNEGDRYTFRVTRLPGIRNIELYNTSKCEACHKSMQAPTVSITKPSYRDLVEGTAAVTCLVEGSFLGNIQITWTVNSRPSPKPQAEIVKTQSGGHTNAQSSHSVSLEQWKKGTTFQCKVATMCLEEITKEVTIKQEAHITTATPIVTISHTCREESSNSTIGQILVCDVSGFSPMEISISWKKNSTLLNSSLYDNGPVVPSGIGYVTYSILKIGRSEGGNGRDVYTCVVHHSSSPKPITADKMVSSGCEGPNAQIHVETIPPSFDDIYQTKSAKLTCRISNVPFAEDLGELNVTWTRERDSTPLETITGQPKEQENRELAFVDATATVCLEEWESGDNYLCKVRHPQLASIETKSLKKQNGRAHGSCGVNKYQLIFVLSRRLSNFGF